MRFITFGRKNQQRIGLMGPQDQIIDVAEITRRYLRGGNPPYLASMQAFIEAGSKALQAAKKAEKYVVAKNVEEQKKLARANALLKSSQAKLLSPIPWPRKNVVMLGINYREHVDEGARARSLDIKYPEWPVFFTKPATTVIGHMGKVVHHKVTDKLDWEIELAVVMGKKGRDIPKDKAYDYVFGYTVCLDMTARELQRQHGQWFKGKSLDTFCPLGPWIVHKSAWRRPTPCGIDLPTINHAKGRNRFCAYALHFDTLWDERTGDENRLLSHFFVSLLAPLDRRIGKRGAGRH